MRNENEIKVNNKITIPALVAHLALKSGLSKEQSETFVKEFFGIISEALSKGESVKVKALGTFKIMNVESRKSVNVTNGEEILIPGHKRIVFLPSKELAEEINSPFSMFESVEIHPEAEVELESEERAEEIPEHPQTVTPEESIQAPIADSEQSSDKPVTELEPVSDEVVPDSEQVSNEPVTNSEQISDEEAEIVDNSVEAEDMDLPSEGYDEIEASAKKGRFRFLWGFLTGLLIALIIVGLGYWFFLREGFPFNRSGNVTDTTAIEEETAGEELSDSIEILEDDSVISESEIAEGDSFPDTRPSDAVVKDVIGDNYFLTTMAKRHYGNNNLWPYIYMENQDFIGHPDRIKPGTPVVIPPLSKYGVDPTNPKDIEKAKRLGEEIYSRYR